MFNFSFDMMMRPGRHPLRLPYTVSLFVVLHYYLLLAGVGGLLLNNLGWIMDLWDLSTIGKRMNLNIIKVLG